MGKMTPTSRSLEWWRSKDCIPWVVEAYNPKIRQRRDLWNAFDLAVIVPEESSTKHGLFQGVHFINVTSGTNHASRRKKVMGSRYAKELLLAAQSDVVIGVMSWRKNAANRWRVWYEFRDYFMDSGAFGEIRE